ncbi:MAG: hypothetical protein AAGC64_05165 [Bacteroidota bacterium]
MKYLSKISLTLHLIIITSVGYANETTTDGKGNKTETQNLQQTDNQKKELRNFDEENAIEENTSNVHINQDSIDDDSVNKYNFIFYFLYKFKYDHEDSP